MAGLVRRVTFAPRRRERGAIRQSGLGSGLVAFAAALLLLAPGVQAETVSPQPALEELLRRIEERDRKLAEREAIIADLLRRVEALEREIGTLRDRSGIVELRDPAAATAFPMVAGTKIPDSAREQAARDAIVLDMLRRIEELERHDATRAQAQRAVVVGGVPIPAPSDIASAQRTAWPVVSRARRQSAQADAEQEPGKARRMDEPGAIAIDEEAAERALERSLTQAGALLLEPGQMEVEPAFQYLRRDQEGPLLVFGDGDTTIVATRLRADEFESGINVRIGLPWDSQGEVGVPFRHKSFSTVAQTATASGLSGTSEDDADATGFGDIRLAFAKTIMREAGWWPDLVARLDWDTDSGHERDGIPVGSGFDELTGSLTALKRQDPLAFVGRVGYRFTFEDRRVDPGNEILFSFGTVLAASPETSLSATLDQTFVGEVEAGGQPISGSDQVDAVLTLGVSSILARRVLLTLSGGIGLTDDAPDYFVGLSLPVGFDVPLP